MINVDDSKNLNTKDVDVKYSFIDFRMFKTKSISRKYYEPKKVQKEYVGRLNITQLIQKINYLTKEDIENQITMRNFIDI